MTTRHGTGVGQSGHRTAWYRQTELSLFSSGATVRQYPRRNGLVCRGIARFPFLSPPEKNFGFFAWMTEVSRQ